MHDDAPILLNIGLAIAIQAPFACCLGFVTRDRREGVMAMLFVLIGAGLAAVTAVLTGSLLLAPLVAFGGVAVLAQARFIVIHRATPPPTASSPAAASSSPPAASAQPAQPALPPLTLGDRLLGLMTFIGNVLEAADRIGELRHRRRMRRIEYQRHRPQPTPPPNALYSGPRDRLEHMRK